MSRNKLLLVLVLLGITVWNIPQTASLFYGDHTYYNGSAPCVKCHQDIQVILDFQGTPERHQQLGCQGCHPRDGNSSHAASYSYCINCHPEAPEHGLTYNCVICHGSHGYKDAKLTHRNESIICSDCHTLQ